jgi:cytochrome P450
LQWLLRPLPFLEDCQRRYGDIFTLQLAGQPRWVVLCRPEDIREVFRHDATTLDHGNDVMRPLVGNHSLLTLNGVRHRRHRKLLTPPFQQTALQALLAEMRTIVRAHLERAGQHIPSTRDLMSAITLDVIQRLVLGASDEHREVRQHLGELLAFTRSSVRTSLLMVEPLQRDLGPWSPWHQLQRRLHQVDAAIHRHITERRRRGGTQTILDLLLAARDEDGRPMTDEELRDELITLLVAGHETTATVLTWILTWVLRDRHIHERLRDETRAAQDEDDLPYTTAVCNEALRLIPVLPTVARVPRQPLTIAEHELRAPTMIVPCIHLVHRRPELYEEPARFHPERFLGRRYAAWEFFPFGGGVRRCIGAGMAVLEMKAVLWELFSRHEVTSARTSRPPRPVRHGVTLRPARQLPLRVQPLAS